MKWELDKQIFHEKRRGHWVYQENAIDFGLGGWVCSRCGTHNCGIPDNKDEDPNILAVGQFCPACGKPMTDEAEFKEYYELMNMLSAHLK